MAGEPTETVTWINVIPLNRREKIARWWVEDVRQQHTYTSKRQREQELQTFLGADLIDGLACDGLRQALLVQKREREQGSGSITFPRATPDGSAYFGSVGIPSRPLNVRFTSHGIEPTLDNENH